MKVRFFKQNQHHSFFLSLFIVHVIVTFTLPLHGLFRHSFNLHRSWFLLFATYLLLVFFSFLPYCSSSGMYFFLCSFLKPLMFFPIFWCPKLVRDFDYHIFFFLLLWIDHHLSKIKAMICSSSSLLFYFYLLLISFTERNFA